MDEQYIGRVACRSGRLVITDSAHIEGDNEVEWEEVESATVGLENESNGWEGGTGVATVGKGHYPIKLTHSNDGRLLRIIIEIDDEAYDDE